MCILMYVSRCSELARVFVCVVAVFTCMGPHMSAQVAGLTETLPTFVAEILPLSHESPQHP